MPRRLLCALAFHLWLRLPAPLRFGRIENALLPYAGEHAYLDEVFPPDFFGPNDDPPF